VRLDSRLSSVFLLDLWVRAFPHVPVPLTLSDFVDLHADVQTFASLRLYSICFACLKICAGGLGNISLEFLAPPFFALRPLTSRDDPATSRPLLRSTQPPAFLERQSAEERFCVRSSLYRFCEFYAAAHRPVLPCSLPLFLPLWLF